MSHVTHAYTYRALTYDGTAWDSLLETAREGLLIRDYKETARDSLLETIRRLLIREPAGTPYQRL